MSDPMKTSGSFENPISDAVDKIGNGDSPRGMRPNSEENGLKNFLDSTPYQVSPPAGALR